VNESQHPTPLFAREAWCNLNGSWRFAYDDARQWEQPSDVEYKLDILVPYPPESQRSGIHDLGFHPVVWYSQVFDAPSVNGSERCLIHFGAVDYRCQVWANGHLIGAHEGGQTPFALDVTHAIRQHATLEIVVRVEDEPSDLSQPRGKQDWELEPHTIWHHRVTGIWQTVWLEVVPVFRIERLHWTPHLENWSIEIEVNVSRSLPAAAKLRVKLTRDGKPLADDTYTLIETHLTRRIQLPDPGIEDARRDLLWSPEHPQLIEARLELIVEEQVVDRVSSYTAMRSAGVIGKHFQLNGQPYYLCLALDQGYWPDGLYTATDAEFRLDIELAKQLGFNGLRKHQKIEDPRWLYHCDRLGMLVWAEMPSHFAFTTTAIERLTREWLEIIERDRSHPCIVTWVPFNESWGVPDLPLSVAQRDYVEGIYRLTKAIDPSRPVSGNDGWEQHASDFFNIHDYAIDSKTILERYGSDAALEVTVKQFRPLGRALSLHEFSPSERAVVFSEFGAFADAVSTVGLDRRASGEAQLLEWYTDLLGAVHACKSLAGFCYTQLTDTFYERNGLLDMSRQAKANVAGIASATRGTHGVLEELDAMGYSQRWRRARERAASQSGINVELKAM